MRCRLGRDVGKRLLARALGGGSFAVAVVASITSAPGEVGSNLKTLETRNANDGNVHSERVHPVYRQNIVSHDQLHALLPDIPEFKSVADLDARCGSEVMIHGSTVAMRLDTFRDQVVGFYQSRYPLMGADQMLDAVIELKKTLAAQCPLAVMQVFLLKIEELLVRVVAGSSKEREFHLVALRDASEFHGEFSMLQAWLAHALPEISDEGKNPLGWPIEQGRSRCQKYYDLLWTDVHDSTDTWAIMENPGSITDQLYHAALKEIAEVLDSFGSGIHWWPCRGTLIALLRHGARSGSLSRGLVDVVERDIDVMLGIPDEVVWIGIGHEINRLLKERGWSGCWTKTSATELSRLKDETRRDILYCVRTDPAYILLDITSYITGVPGPSVFVHRVCGARAAAVGTAETAGVIEAALGAMDGMGIVANAAERDSGGGGDRSGSSAGMVDIGLNCTVPSNIGPLRYGGGVLRRDAIYPLGRCRASDFAVPCPHLPLETIRAMAHSSLSASCVALPTVVGRDLEEHATRQLNEKGLCAEDVGILRERSAWLEALGYQSMAPLFEACEHLNEVLATPCHYPSISPTWTSQ
eukprot:TRINITY_DN74393_c0_g1_i1.p1 TRINITY_DN74393_c0_g1~~TRINITY_DN74393_c0_g1_i1.p1  ORF type:complete len:583 (-),score=73.06 TRINITY_DN74393_c0_g1_i1:51-1799(-)